MPKSDNVVETKFPEIKVPKEVRQEADDVSPGSSETESMAKLKKYLRAKSKN